jgi:hypothetical protein
MDTVRYVILKWLSIDFVRFIQSQRIVTFTAKYGTVIARLRIYRISSHSHEIYSTSNNNNGSSYIAHFTNVSNSQMSQIHKCLKFTNVSNSQMSQIHKCNKWY